MSTPSSSYPSLSTKGLSFTGRRVDRLVRDNFRLLGESIRFPLPGAHRIGWNKPYNRLQKVAREGRGREGAGGMKKRNDVRVVSIRDHPLTLPLLSIRESS